MRRNGRPYSLLSLAVSLSLLMQMLMPLAGLTTAVSLKAQSAPEPVATPAAPAALTAPAAISRVQSSYGSGDTIDVVYTITNNQMPTLLPEIPDTATVTDTVDALAAVDLAADANTLRDVTVQTTLTGGTLVNGHGAAVSGSSLTWTLGDLPPMASANITLTVQAPSTAATFVELDSGTAVSGTLWDTAVTAIARPATIVPDTIDPAYLAATPDANPHDEAMLRAAADFAQSPAAAFALVQSFTFDPYKGSLRGTRGTLLGQAGNSLDKASLLIAMLRAAGVPARYRHGTLSTTDAQTLLGSMFAFTDGVAGAIPAGSGLADPVNDPALLAVVQDHWWVEAYLPGSGWTNLDPSFAAAAIGDSYAAPGANDRIAEIPDNFRHKTAVSVRREYYSSFPIGGVFLQEDEVMTVEYATAEIAGRALTFAHMVNTDAPGGLVFGTITHTFTPYFMLDDDAETAILGSTFQDILTTFPLATSFTTAAWLTFALTDLDGNTQTFERTVKDDLGPDIRLNGGSPNLARGEDSPPFFGASDLMTTLFLPHAVWPQTLDEVRGTMLARLVETAVLMTAADALPDDGSPEAETLAAQASLNLQILLAQTHALTAYDFAVQGDALLQQIGDGLHVKLFYTLPRIVTLTTTADEDAGTTTESIDLRNTTAAAIVAPGQATAALHTANWVKGIGESALEGAVLSDFYGEPAVTTAAIFEQMHIQGIDPVLLTSADLDQLHIYPFPADVQALLANTLLTGKNVLIPNTAVQIDGAPTFGWWQIDPTDGTTIGVLADGSHGALIEYVNFLGYKRYKALKRVYGTPVKKLYNYLVKNLSPALGGGNPRLALAAAATTPDWRYLPPHLCPIDNCGTEQFFLADVAPSPIPLPDMLFAYAPAGQPADASAVTTLAITGSGGSSAVLTPAPAAAAITPFAAATFDIGLTASFSDDFVVQVHAPAGWHAVLSGSSATITPPAAAAAGSYNVTIVAQSKNQPTVTATAVFPITLSVPNQLAFAVTAEPNITIPQNDALFTAVSNQTNDGEAEIPDSAYRIDLTNESGSSKTFNVTVSGAPAGWVVLDGAEQTATAVTLPAGQSTTLGLYLQPDTLPAPGTGHTITIAASDGGSLSDSAIINWTMPGQPHSYLTVAPDTLFMEANSSVDFDLSLTNVGNSAGNFSLAATTPLTTATIANLQASVALNPGASGSQTATLNVGDAALGARYPLQITSADPNGYTQYALADIQIVSPVSGALFTAARSCTLDSPSLADSLETVAQNAVQLEYWCTQGDCPLVLRDNVANAADSAAIFADSLTFGSNLATIDPVRTAAANLAAETTNADILTALADLSTAVFTLHTDLCEVGEHRASARFTPYLDAVLLGDNASFTLDVTNHGTIATTYAITVTGAPGGDQVFSPTINPGETANLPVNVNPAALGALDLSAAVDAVAPDVVVPVGTTAAARLNVVDKFVQVTAVTANPPFVDTGISQTSLSIDVNNVAGIAQSVTAETAVLAADGTVQAQLAPLLDILIGTRSYNLGTVDTSGWAAGTYTITVNLLDGSSALVPDGTGSTAFAVGQSLLATMDVTPQVVAPGDVTVTTVITTELQADAAISPQQPAAALWPATGLRSVLAEETAVSHSPTPAPRSPILNPPSPITDPPATQLPEKPDTILGTIITRYEQDEAVTTGSWVSVGYSETSSGTYMRADTAGETAEFTVTGNWIQIGFLGDFNSGHAEIFIDGISQGIIDLYRRDFTPISFVYDGLSNGSHTVTIVALGTANPLSGSDFVQLDYLDVYNGGSYTDGAFEQNDSRLFLSTNWTTTNDANASGGSYINAGTATAWFPFVGDSVTYQAVANPNGGRAQVFIDGIYQTTIDLYHPLTAITRTLSFEGLGPGPHVMQIASYRGNVTVDAFITPGTAPFFTPPPVGSFTRYEEDYPALLYNGLPYTTTARTWIRSILRSEPSDGQHLYSNTAGDTISFTFDGVWASIGFYTNEASGQAEIFIDGTSQGIVDLYTNEEEVTSFSYDLTPGTHTISVTVLGTANPLATNEWVHFDYIDVWDGSPLPAGTFEELNGRVLRSGGWDVSADAGVSGGTYIETGLGGQPTFWFPFTGDSVTYQAFNYLRSHEVAIYIDEVFQGYYDIRTGTAPTITHSFENLGSGLHILKVRHYREEATLDAFITPAVTPQDPPPAPQIFTRIEEDNSAVRYNGLPFATTAATWSRSTNNGVASDGQYITSSTAGDTISYTFTGTWAHVGFVTNRFGGRAEILIDGVSQGIVDLYSRADDVASFTFGGLTNSTHTISVTVLGTSNPNASGTQVSFDYFDIWNGTDLPTGTYEENHPLVYRSDLPDDWVTFTDPAASGGTYMSDDFFSNNGTVWFPFTGDTITFLGMATNTGGRAEISIDGVSQGTFNLYNNVPISRPFSFAGLGTGPHILQIRHNRGEPNVDAFITPGAAPFHQPTTPTGIVRYEEDNPTLLYNHSAPWRTRPQSWGVVTTYNTVSGGWHVASSQVGDTVSLTFDGSWAAAGFRVRNQTGQAEIFIDGVSQGIFDLQNTAGEDVRAFQFGNLITGTHTISVSVVAGTVYFDYFDVWDGQPMPDDLVNVSRATDNSRVHLTNNITDVTSDVAIGGDFVRPSLYYDVSNIWFTFVGDSFTLYGYTYIYESTVDVYIDGVLVDSPQFQYPYTEQPLAYHYTGLEPGPHVVRISNVDTMRIDAFQANPAAPVPYRPLAEWWDDAPAGNGAPFFGTYGIGAGMAAGDLDGDGSVEIVVSGDDSTNFGTLFVYRGDGADTGDGDPILWSHNFGGGTFRTWVSSPALAELDGQPGAEVIVAAGNELWAFHADGSTYWTVPTASIFETLSAPAVANLDLDPEPEIVVNLGTTVEVREHDGTLAWSLAYPNHANPPVLADLTGDGVLDIIITGWDDDVLVYDYNNGTPQLVWSVVLTSSMAGTFGAPAVANIDSDPGPEVIVSHYGALTVFNGEDGTIDWTILLDPGNPGGVSVADLDGDGAVEILTGMRYEFETDRFGMLYALETDGSLLWSAIAEDSSSANNAAALDLNGDGAYEVAWNGQEQGFTIYNGVDGTVLFNEPLANSATGTDYPIFVDVDVDGYAEIVVPTIRGIVVFGQDGVWDETRPLWNQHSYHVTNINDNLTVPQYEYNSWEVHNTYRTQYPQAQVLPVYDVDVTYTAATNQVTVLEPSISLTPTLIAAPLYTFDYTQEWFQPVITFTLDSEVTNLQPGEVRQVAAGAVVTYTLPTGANVLTLPPLYVSAAHLVTLAQESATVTAGQTAVFTATLFNPGTAADTFTLDMAGPAAGWVNFPPSVMVPAGGEVTVTFTVTVPIGAPAGAMPLLVDVANGGGSRDTGQLTLTVLPDTPPPFVAPDTAAVLVTLQPETAVGGPGVTSVYTVTVSNLGSQTDTYDLAAVVPPGWGAELVQAGTAVSTLTVLPAADAQTQLRLLLTPPTGTTAGSYPVTVTAVSQTDSGITAQTTATHSVGSRGVSLVMSPAARTIAYGQTATWNLTVTNSGSVPDTFDLTAAGVAAPWVTLSTNSVSLNPGQAQVVAVTAANVALLPQTAVLAVAAISQANPAIAAETRVDLTVTAVTDLALAWTPASQTITDTLATFSLVFTNTGNVLTGYSLSVTAAGASAQAGSTQVDVPAGFGAVVPVTVTVPGPGTYNVVATAVLPGGAVRTVTAELVVTTTDSGLILYLPLIVK